MTHETKLRPCPFCGGEPLLKQYRADGLEIKCQSCHSGRQQRWLHKGRDWLAAKMIEKWNARAAPPEDVRAVVDEPVQIIAVAVTREDDEEGLRIEWLLEGGITELEFAGTVLFAMPEANDLCDEDGSAELHRRPQCSEVSQQCSEHLRTQGKLLPLHTLLPHPPRHEGFLQPEREVPGYTIEQMKEYGALCAAEALRQNK